MRATSGAPVSALCTWQEIEAGLVAPRSFSLRTMAERAAAVGDLWSEIGTSGRGLNAAIKRLPAL